jgi:hypothetical protein
MGYKKPTIIEIYIECFFAPSMLKVSRLFDVVPALREKGFTDIELQPSFQVGIGEPNLQPRIRCWSEGRKKLIQRPLQFHSEVEAGIYTTAAAIRYGPSRN